MTLPLNDTLETARYKVLLRCGMAQQSSHNPNIQPVIDDFIRSAHHQFFNELDWIALKQRGTITLINDQTAYDFPDETNVGLINRIWCVDTDGVPYEIYPEPTAEQRYSVGSDAARPVFYEVRDGGINFFPATDADTYPTVYFEYVERESSLAQDSDRLQIDSELVVLKATAAARTFLGMPGAKECMDEAAYLLRQIKAKNASGESASIATYPRPRLYSSRYAQQNRQYNYAGGGATSFIDQRGRLIEF